VGAEQAPDHSRHDPRSHDHGGSSPAHRREESEAQAETSRASAGAEGGAHVLWTTGLDAPAIGGASDPGLDAFALSWGTLAWALRGRCRFCGRRMNPVGKKTAGQSDHFLNFLESRRRLSAA
jgi:hypothetical protein